MKTKEQLEVEEGFYQQIADLLGIEHNYVTPHYRLTRWNNRKPGNGRFPGFGVVRVYGPTVVHMMLTSPVSINRQFTSMDSALDHLRKLLEQ